MPCALVTGISLIAVNNDAVLIHVADLDVISSADTFVCERLSVVDVYEHELVLVAVHLVNETLEPASVAILFHCSMY